MTDQLPVSKRHPEVQRLHGYFDYHHLPDHLQQVSRHFAITADVLLRLLPDSPELTVALRKLLESKDCAVRSALVLPATFREDDDPSAMDTQ
jgi:hypothetical protein